MEVMFRVKPRDIVRVMRLIGQRVQKNSEQPGEEAMLALVVAECIVLMVKKSWPYLEEADAVIDEFRVEAKLVALKSGDMTTLVALVVVMPGVRFLANGLKVVVVVSNGEVKITPILVERNIGVYQRALLQVVVVLKQVVTFGVQLSQRLKRYGLTLNK